MICEKITSRNNPLIKDTAKLSDKKCRENEGLFAFEGRKLLSEAISSGAPLQRVFATEKAMPEVQRLSPCCPVYPVSDEVYEKISFEKSPEGIFSVSKPLDKFHNIYIIYRREDISKCGSIFILDGIRDPGNLGTVLRTASAFGCKTVIMSDDCADIYNSKTVRASMGAIFRQRTVRVKDLASTVLELKASGRTVLSAALSDNSVSLFDTEITEDTVFIVGNEGNGIRDEVLKASGGSVIIPMENGTESLNAAAAATVLLYEQYKAGR